MPLSFAAAFGLFRKWLKRHFLDEGVEQHRSEAIWIAAINLNGLFAPA
jgi:hypothetical protein